MYLQKRIAQVIVFVPLIFGTHHSYATDLDEFLERKAVKIDSSEVIEGINQFLNYQSVKEDTRWFKGSFLTTEDVRYTDLHINFNVWDNSLYLLNKGIVYRVSNFYLKGFEIVQDGKKLFFKKGFAIASSAKILVKFNGSANDLIQYLTTYSKFSELQITDILITRNQETQLILKITTGFRDEVVSLKKYMALNENVVSSSSDFMVSELERTKYLQVLYEHEKFTVLKYHFKRKATAEPVSVVKHSSAFLFDDEDYYIADSNKHLQEFLFTKKSIEKVLTSLKITSSEKLKNVGTESRAVEWFRTSTFN